MKYVVVGYYTIGTLYEAKAHILIKSLERHDVPHYIEGVENLGSWKKNTGYKPTFLKRMLLKFPGVNVVYVDVDAEFLKYPILFDTLDCNVGVYVFDRSCYSKSIGGFEVLSGTVFLKNNLEVYNIVEKWEKECQTHPDIWDQKSLEKTLNGDFYTIPGEYCKIFDQMKHITDPIIVHYQASRTVRKQKGKLD